MNENEMEVRQLGKTVGAAWDRDGEVGDNVGAEMFYFSVRLCGP